MQSEHTLTWSAWQAASKLIQSGPCRCEASDSNSKPGLLSGIKNTFRDIWFSKQGRDSEKSIPEPDAQPQPATDIATCSSDTSWQEWAEVHYRALHVALLPPFGQLAIT